MAATFELVAVGQNLDTFATYLVQRDDHDKLAISSIGSSGSGRDGQGTRGRFNWLSALNLTDIEAAGKAFDY
jgi:hypothetical protein